MRKLTLAVLVIAIMTTMAQFAVAEGQHSSSSASFPQKPITILVGYSVGGGTDVITRKLAADMKTYLKVPVLVKNMPGGGGLVSMKALTTTAPNGYTLGDLLANQFLQKYDKNSPSWIDPLKAVTPIAVFNEDAWGIAVQGNASYSTLKGFVQYAKSHPGLKVGAGAPGTLYYFAWKAFMQKTGTEFTIVSYKGTSLSLKAVAGGKITAAGAGAGEAASLSEAGLVKMIGISANQRLGAYPNIPTFNEQGIDFVFGPWRSLVAPAGLPKSIQQKLVSAVDKAYHSSDFQNFMDKQGFGKLYMGPDKTMQFYKQQDTYFKDLMKNAGLSRSGQ